MIILNRIKLGIEDLILLCLCFYTRRKLVHYNPVYCDLALATYGKKMHKQIIFIVNHRVSVVNCPKIAGKNLQFDNWIDLFMHFLIVEYNGKVTTDGCNGQVFF